MHSTACHRQKSETKHNPQNQPTEEERGGEKNLNCHTWKISLKKLINYELQQKYQMMAIKANGFNTFLTNT